MADTPPPLSPLPRRLRREVLLPDSPGPGWGMVAVVASAMSFALAASLLVVRATEIQRPHVCPRARPVVVQPPAAPAPSDSCHGPVYRSHNGETEAVFELCPPAR